MSNNKNSDRKIWILSKMKQNSVALKLGEFCTKYFHLISISIHVKINWKKRMAAVKCYRMFEQINIIMIFQKFSLSSNKGPFKHQLNANWLLEKTNYLILPI